MSEHRFLEELLSRDDPSLVFALGLLLGELYRRGYDVAKIMTIADELTREMPRRPA